MTTKETQISGLCTASKLLQNERKALKRLKKLRLSNPTRKKKKRISLRNLKNLIKLKAR